MRVICLAKGEKNISFLITALSQFGIDNTQQWSTLFNYPINDTVNLK